MQHNIARSVGLRVTSPVHPFYYLWYIPGACNFLKLLFAFSCSDLFIAFQILEGEGMGDRLPRHTSGHYMLYIT